MSARLRVALVARAARAAGFAATVAASLASVSVAAAAQRGPRIVVGVGAATAQLERSGAAAPLSGLLVGAGGRVAFRALALEVAYAQGTLSVDGASSPSEDLVDGEVMLAAQVVPWLVLSAGPHLRALVTPAGTERWVRWEARAHVDTDLVPGALRADAELSTALAAEVNTATGSASALGASVGITLRVANSPFGLRLGYGVDRASTAGGAEQVMQSVGLRLSVGRR